MKRVVIEELSNENFEKLESFLNELNISFEIDENYDISDDDYNAEKYINTFADIKLLFEANNIGNVDVHILHHYNPNYNCDNISMVAAGFKHWHMDVELDNLTEKIFDLIEDIDLYARLYSLDVEKVKLWLDDAGLNYSEIFETSDDDS